MRVTPDLGYACQLERISPGFSYPISTALWKQFSFSLSLLLQHLSPSPSGDVLQQHEGHDAIVRSVLNRFFVRDQRFTCLPLPAVFTCPLRCGDHFSSSSCVFTFFSISRRKNNLAWWLNMFAHFWCLVSPPSPLFSLSILGLACVFVSVAFVCQWRNTGHTSARRVYISRILPSHLGGLCGNVL